MKTQIEAKADIFTPAFETTDGASLFVKPGTIVGGHPLAEKVAMPEELQPGTDYAIGVENGVAAAASLAVPPDASFIGGFHVGLDGKIVVPSIWDGRFRPKARDPRGMSLNGDFWMDVYLLNTSPHIHGTSKAGQTIASGANPIHLPDGSSLPVNWWNVVKILANFGKQLPSLAEFSVAMEGVEEGKNCVVRPEKTGHVEGLRSAVGCEQAAGCIYIWGRDFAPSGGYAIVMGGYWGSDAAGPRQFGDGLPGADNYDIGARGRCDHLILG